MRRVVAVGICLAFLAFGLVRIGVATALSAQMLGLLSAAPLQSAINDTSRFLVEHNADAFIPLTPLPYFAIIFTMGLALALGAVGAFRQRIWGYALIVIYLLMHAGLFLNFWTINPKVAILAVGIVLLLLLITVNSGPVRRGERRDRAQSDPQRA